jgi:hypothetical protein
VNNSLPHSPLRVSLHIAGAGWADATISNGHTELSIEAISYISDGIAEMAAAAKALLQGAETAAFAFQHEPGEHAFVLTRGPHDTLKIEIFENNRNFKGKSDTPVMTITCPVLDFVGQVFSVLHSWRIEHGDHYKERWRHDFPLDAYDFIRRTI